MKYLSVLTLFLFYLTTYAQDAVEKVHVPEFREKKMDLENKDNNFYYDSQYVSYENARFILRNMSLKDPWTVSVYGVPNEENKYIMWVRLDEKRDARYMFVDISNHEFKYIFQDKRNVYDGGPRSLTFFSHKKEKLIAIHHGDEGSSFPMTYLLSDGKITKMPEIDFCYVCSNYDCNDDFFRKAYVTYMDGAYYISIYSNLGTCAKQTENLNLDGKRRFVFKLTTKSFTRLKEYETSDKP